MEVINLAVSQMNGNKQDYMGHPFFIEYLKVFNKSDVFYKTADELVKNYTSKEIDESISFLETSTTQVLRNISDLIPIDFKIGIIVFFGDCSYDGHGILLNGKPYVFFDLSAIIPRLNIYNFNTFLAHELIHSIHYFINPDFYRGNVRSTKEKYYKLIFAEGIATKLSSVLSNSSNEQMYWFDFLDSSSVESWIINCENIKDKVGRELEVAINGELFNKTLYNRLFSIENFEKMDEYRIGYYYGERIVNQLLENKPMVEVLRISYDEAVKHISNYFSITVN